MSAIIDAQLVKTLREKTNAGLMACKAALAEASGDLEAAVDILRKKGAATAQGKAGREAKEGIIAQAILPGAKVGVLVEINCETDFVAKNEGFRTFCDDIAKKYAQQPGVDLESDRVAAVQKIGENIVLRRHERIEVKESGLVAAYI
ncbi:MAG TPA: translation elongation factor Ts, partial [Chthoniobacteraceae bacterium]